jgi:hypothetical protein
VAKGISDAVDSFADYVKKMMAGQTDSKRRLFSASATVHVRTHRVTHLHISTHRITTEIRILMTTPPLPPFPKVTAAQRENSELYLIVNHLAKEFVGPSVSMDSMLCDATVVLLRACGERLDKLSDTLIGKDIHAHEVMQKC